MLIEYYQINPHFLIGGISLTLCFEVTRAMVFVLTGHIIPEFYVYIIHVYGYNKINVLGTSHLPAMPIGALHTLYSLIMLIKIKQVHLVSRLASSPQRRKSLGHSCPIEMLTCLGKWLSAM